MAGAVAVTLLAACHRGPGEAGETRRAIAASTARYVEASRAGDAHGLAQLYDEHAILLPPDGEPVEGRDPIEAYWKRGAAWRIPSAAGRCRLPTRNPPIPASSSSAGSGSMAHGGSPPTSGTAA